MPACRIAPGLTPLALAAALTACEPAETERSVDTAPAAATAATEQVLPAMPDLEPFQAVLQRADAEVASAEARHAQAARDLARLKPLWDAKVASDRDYDDAVSAAVRAWADVERARVQRTQAVLFSRITGSVDTGAGIPRR